MDRKIRITYLIGTLGSGGSERQLYELARRLDKERFEAHVICLSNITEPYAEKLKDHGINVSVIDRAARFDPSLIFKVRTLIKRMKTDVIHSFLLDASFYGFVAGKMANVRSIISSNRGIFREKSSIRYVKNRFVLSKSSVVIVNSKATEWFTKEFYALKKNNLALVYNGIDTTNFAPDDAVAARLKRELGLENAQAVIGTAGRLFPVKNHGFLLRVSRALMDTYGNNLFFLLLGEGPLLEQLQKKSRDLGLEKNFIFLGRRNNIADYLNVLDIFVLTSESEALPNAILEAMSLGKPVVTFDVGGCGELVRDGENGFLVPFMDHQMFCERLKRLIDNEDLRRRMGRKGQERVHSDFSMAKMVSTMESMYTGFFDRDHGSRAR